MGIGEQGYYNKRNDLLEALYVAAVDVVKAEDCDKHFTCPDNTGFWSGEGEEKPGKPWCPWSVRPGKCQPHVAMNILREYIEILEKFKITSCWACYGTGKVWVKCSEHGSLSKTDCPICSGDEHEKD